MPLSLDDINKSFNGNFLDELTYQLYQLPKYDAAVEREKKYWTAEQIKDILGLSFTPQEIEDVLLELWKDDKLGKIRPAKYPHQSKLVRLWGHVDNLYPLDKKELHQYRYDQVERYEEPNLPNDAPNIFLSFSYVDKDLATAIRARFAEWGWRTWLYINKIQLKGKIAEEVKSAVSDCDAAFVLISAVSIGSAWIYTEFETLTKMTKPVCAIFNANDTALLNVLATWECGKNYENNYSKEKADLLVKIYENKKGIHHVDGYRITMETFLSCLSVFHKLTFYLNCPKDWQGSRKFIGFNSLKLDELYQ